MSSFCNEPKSNDLCRVCDDEASGFHYGILSCHGCKTFFCRTVKENKIYTCKKQGNCPITKETRNACKQCRFQKCMEVGMNKKALQPKRKPIGYTRRRRRQKSRSETPESDTPDPVLEAEDSFLISLSEIETEANRLRVSNYYNEKTLTEALNSPCTLQDDDIMTSITEPSAEHTISSFFYASSFDMYYWYERELVVMIEWAKMIPAYQSISMNDKMALLRHSSIVYPILIHTFWGPDYGLDHIVLPSGAFIDRTPEPTRSNVFNKNKCRILNELLNPMRTLNIDCIEFASFKTMIFFNPDANGVHSKSEISDAKKSIAGALYRYMTKKNDWKEGEDRFTKLLLLGTVLESIAVEMKEEAIVNDVFKNAQFSDCARRLIYGI